MKLVLIIMSAIMLTSCATSTMIQNPRDVPKYAPKGYKQTGSVKYLNQGADSVIADRRNDAFKQMYESCNGDYRVISESNQATTRTISSNGYGGLNAYDGNHYMFIDFECVGESDNTVTKKPSAPIESKNCGLVGKIFGC
ncbi:MAG: hypothetical protein AB7I27_00460 [Bacteriovoracaceae bacterium]